MTVWTGSSFVVTGGGRGIGRAVVERLAAEGAGVVVVELDASSLEWVRPSSARIATVIGSAADPDVAQHAADRAGQLGRLHGWVNNAAVFRDAALHSHAPEEVLERIGANLAPVVVGCATAVRHFRAAGQGGAIVNVSSHQAQRAVRGALPYATAKAAIEGLTRAAAVDYGPDGIRVNAVALGSIDTERYQVLLRGNIAADRVQSQMAELHPLGRVGRVDEVADSIAYLLCDRASFVTGVVLPVDGGRAGPRSGPRTDLTRAALLRRVTDRGTEGRRNRGLPATRIRHSADRVAGPDRDHLAAWALARPGHGAPRWRAPRRSAGPPWLPAVLHSPAAWSPWRSSASSTRSSPDDDRRRDVLSSRPECGVTGARSGRTRPGRQCGHAGRGRRRSRRTAGDAAAH